MPMEPFAEIFPDPAIPKVPAITRPKSPSGETRPAIGGQVAHEGRGAADHGEYRQAARTNVGRVPLLP